MHALLSTPAAAPLGPCARVASLFEPKLILIPSDDSSLKHVEGSLVETVSQPPIPVKNSDSSELSTSSSIIIVLFFRITLSPSSTVLREGRKRMLDRAAENGRTKQLIILTHTKIRNNSPFSQRLQLRRAAGCCIRAMLTLLEVQECQSAKEDSLC